MNIWIKKEDDCDPTEGWESSYIMTINRDTGSTVFSSLPYIWYHMNQLVIGPLYEDLFIIGLSIFAVDKRVCRRDFPDGWTRNINVSIPVLEIEKWSSLAGKWDTLLSFLTGDRWSISFRKTEAIYSKHENINRKRIDVSGCDCVSLFSGGLDSYCGAIKLLEAGRSPLLIGHNEYPKLRYIQEKFCRDFSECYPNQHPVFIGFTAGARAPTAVSGEILNHSENTSRGRSLLFLCAAISVAGIMGTNIPVYIPENGFIGINVSLTNCRKGSCSTRTTHPYFITGFAEIIREVGISNTICNFFAYNTKREIVQMVSHTDAFMRGYKETISCSHPCVARYSKRGSREFPVNCGYCYPCLIRKSSLQDIESNGKYSNEMLPSQFFNREVDSETSADFYALLSSIHRFKQSSEKDIHRMIRCTGKLSLEEENEYERVYSAGINDLIDMLSRDPEMSRLL
jgi:7-cyano-7-deazaguanine synthase in queuosine biosynthesis